MTNKINSIIAFGAVLFIGLACSFSTANLGEIKFDKDKSGANPATVFNPDDEIFAISSINNADGKNKIKCRVLFDDVEEREAGALAHKLAVEKELEGDRDIWFNFSVPGGFYPGRYKAEFVLSGEDGKELDRKTATFTIKAGNSTDTNRTKKDRETEKTPSRKL
jgi:hypothetical protein